jgi:hypothetical protein
MGRKNLLRPPHMYFLESKGSLRANPLKRNKKKGRKERANRTLGSDIMEV